MKITINTFGTRGDVQPYIALGLGLKKSGHSVRVVTHLIFESFVRECGLDYYPLKVDPRQVLINQALSELGNNTIRVNRWMEKNFKSALQDIFIATLDANRDTELMLNSGLSFAGWHVAEKLEIPAIASYLWPVTPSRFLPAASGKIPPDWLPFRGVINYLSTKFSNQLFFMLLLSSVNNCREGILDLKPMKAWEYWTLDSPRSSTSLIYGFSPLVIPKPADWRDNQQVAGYWFLDRKTEYQPDQSLLDFLANGTPPIYVGFGSMVDHKQQEFIQIVINALRDVNQRGVLLSGWSELGSEHLPKSIYLVEAVPHDWLFPRMAAVVHHGGAGTTAAGLRAGVPTVVVPSFGDQYFWGWRVHEIGAGSEPIPRQKLTSAGLANAIQQVVSDNSIKRKVSKIGQQIQAENGVENAVRLIETFARNGHL